MKDSKQYAEKIQKLYHSLKRKYPKVQKVSYDEPVDAMVYAIISENMTESQAEAAIRRFTDHFVDWNDLRVSSADEIVELLGVADTTLARSTAATLTGTLNAIFDKYNMITLTALKKIGKRPAKLALEKINGTTHYVVSYCMLTSLQSHSIPLTEKMIKYLISNQMVSPSADKEQIEGFLARQISAGNAYEFYFLLRQDSESTEPKAKKTIEKKKETVSKPETKKKKTKTK